METDIGSVVFGLVFAFVFPLFGYLTGLAWNKVVGAPVKINKIWATFCLTLPIIFLSMMVKLGFETLRHLWVTSPYVSVVLLVLFGLLAPAGLISLIVRLWRPKHW